MSKKKFTPLEKAAAKAGEAYADVLISALKYKKAVENYNQRAKELDEEAAIETIHNLLMLVEAALGMELTWEQAEKLLPVLAAGIVVINEDKAGK